MSMRRFTHATASSPVQARELSLSRPGRTAFVAGGTDILGTLKDGIHAAPPELLIDLKPIGALRGISDGKGGLRIGALTTLADVCGSPDVRGRYPLLAQAARSVASPQIRNMGTVGGNLCQEPRCWYYRSPDNLFPCLRKGGERCNAVLGDNRHHSLFGAARTGDPGCRSGCPAGVAIPAYLELIRTGHMEEAARLVLENNPLPAVTGRVCPHFCEQGCNRSLLDTAVSTRSVERFIGDLVLGRAGSFYAAPRKGTGKEAAVVGAGPAGLAAAFFLRRAGHDVTVFDDHPEAGGMLRYCLPAYRMPGDVLDRQVAALEGMGIRFALGTAVGRGKVTLAALRRDFDAVFLATGTWESRKLGLENEGLLGSGLAFLSDIRNGRTPRVGKRVLVIGGGSVAVDVAVSARRLGAAEVTMACLEARDRMPAFAEDLELAVEEGIRFLPSWGPRRVLSRGGEVHGMELVRCTSVLDAEGRFRPSFDPGSVMTAEADQVLVAIGQAVDLSYAGASLTTPRGLLSADEGTQATPLAGVYAGGDAVSGVGTVTGAIAAGRRAALAMNAELSGRAPKPGAAARGGKPRGAPSETVAVNAAALTPRARAKADVLPVPVRAIDREDAATLDLRAVENEAGRCINCGCVAVHASDMGPALVALDARIRTDRRTIRAEEFFAARIASCTVLEPGELVMEILLPPPPADCVQRYLKFRVRNAIDFPIVSVACRLSLKEGRVADARISLGAVAAAPLRAREAEAFLAGREIDEETAEAAGSLAVRGAVALPCNGHKAQILRTLVKRAILGESG
jgi:NADPH-dependent glutamate synthase beta subunit-like oxidoreductase/CO/xanthine dehydrogenase FAD-binding subunit